LDIGTRIDPAITLRRVTASFPLQSCGDVFGAWMIAGGGAA